MANRARRSDEAFRDYRKALRDEEHQLRRRLSGTYIDGRYKGSNVLDAINTEKAMLGIYR